MFWKHHCRQLVCLPYRIMWTKSYITLYIYNDRVMLGADRSAIQIADVYAKPRNMILFMCVAM